MGYMLEIQNIHKTFNPGTINEKVALNGVNLNLNPGDFVTIIGGNGAGKSTTLNAIAGVWPVDEGKIIIDGVDITKLSEHKRALYLGRVFQDPMTGTAATMSDEELMEFIVGLNNYCLAGIGKCDCSNEGAAYCEDICKRKTMEWLQSEADRR